MISVKNNESEIFKEIIKPCRSGKFVYVCVSRKYQINELKKLFNKNGIVEKRGLYSFNGFIALTSEFRRRFFKYFDIIVKVEDGRQTRN